MTLRTVTPDDAEFLFSVYASTREEELAAVPWSVAEKESFLRHQAAAQHADYRATYPAAEFLVILEEDRAVGRLYLDRAPGEIRVLDIALLPSWRGRGIGTRLLADLQAEAAASGAVASLHVAVGNRARRLYERLGFVCVEHGEVYDRLEWRPPITTGG